MWLKKLLKAYKKKSRISFMIVPQFHGKARSITFSVGWLIGIGGFLLFFSLINFYIWFNYTSQVNQVFKLRNINSKLRSENQMVKPALKKQGEVDRKFAEIIKQREAIMNEAQALNKKTGRKFSLPSRSMDQGLNRANTILLKPVYDPKNQMINASTLQENAELLEAAMEKESRNLQSLLQTLKALNRQVDHTPSIWPVYGRITSRFSYKRLDPVSRSKYRPHQGIDIQAKIGTPVRATADGTVVFTGWHGGYGYKVQINHGYGIQTVYAHLSRIAVVQGQKVKKGKIIAYSGNTGNSTGPHLHYEVRMANRPINPSPYLSW